MRHRRTSTPVSRPPEPQPPVERPLAGASNQALARLLARAPKPPTRRTDIKDIENLDATIDAAEWERRLNANESVIPLYADLATQLGTAGLRDVKGTDVKHINPALTPTPDQVKPGLNFVSRGLSKGRTQFLVNGKLENKLADTKQGPLPELVIMLGPAVFIPGNKAFALATLRHEIEHAVHDQMAIDWLHQWRTKGGARGDFRVWLGDQAISQTDRQLVGERFTGGTVNTEVLAHLAGFITAFPHQDHATANADRSVYDQLRAIGEHWGPAADDVKAEAVKRITEMKKSQKGAALTALKAAFTRLEGEKDAPKALVDAVLSAP